MTERSKHRKWSLCMFSNEPPIWSLLKTLKFKSALARDPGSSKRNAHMFRWRLISKSWTHPEQILTYSCCMQRFNYPAADAMLAHWRRVFTAPLINVNRHCWGTGLGHDLPCSLLGYRPHQVFVGLSDMLDSIYPWCLLSLGSAKYQQQIRPMTRLINEAV